MDPDITNLRFKIEQEIAKFLISRLESQKIDPYRAQEIAKFVITSIPENINDQQMLDLIPSLDDEFTELSSIVSKNLSEINETQKQAKLLEVRALISQYLKKKNV